MLVCSMERIAAACVNYIRAPLLLCLMASSDTGQFEGESADGNGLPHGSIPVEG